MKLKDVTAAQIDAAMERADRDLAGVEVFGDYQKLVACRELREMALRTVRGAGCPDNGRMLIEEIDLFSLTLGCLITGMQAGLYVAEALEKEKNNA